MLAPNTLFFAHLCFSGIVRGVELRHLRYFVTVAELLNFTKAAAKLRVAQPALSRQVRDLEDELGVKLIERTSRSARLTDAGKVFITEAKAILQRAEDATKLARAVGRGEQGEIHVGYAPSLTVELLPCMLHTFHNAAPGVQVKLHDQSTDEMVRGLNEGKLHLALMARPSKEELRGLTFELLREYPMCVAMQLTHRLARAKEITVAQIADEPLVAYSRADYPEYHATLAELFTTIGRTPRIAEEHDSATSLIAAAEIGRGLAIVPQCIGMLAGGRLKLRPLQGAPSVHLGVAYDGLRASSAASKFLGAARGSAREEKPITRRTAKSASS
jgi:DNA-binding transcriptional LysR family regulator